MPLILLGIIAIGAGLLLIFYLSGGGRSRRASSGKRAPSNRPKRYETSEDGKVVYLFNKNRAAEQDSGEPSGTVEPGGDGNEDNKTGDDN